MIIVTTARLRIRRLLPADAEVFHRYRNDPEVARFQEWSLPYSIDDARALAAETGELFAKGEWTQLALEHRESNKLIGDLGVRVEAEEPTAELGFTVAREHWGNGYGSEALGALSEHLLSERGFVRVVAFTHHENMPAQHALERAGLTAVAVDGDELVYTRRTDT